MYTASDIYLAAKRAVPYLLSVLASMVQWTGMILAWAGVALIAARLLEISQPLDHWRDLTSGFALIGVGVVVVGLSDLIFKAHLHAWKAMQSPDVPTTDLPEVPSR